MTGYPKNKQPAPAWKTNSRKWIGVREALKDWEQGKLSAEAAIIAIGILVNGSRRPTIEEIAYGRRLESEAHSPL